MTFLTQLILNSSVNAIDVAHSKDTSSVVVEEDEEAEFQSFLRTDETTGIKVWAVNTTSGRKYIELFNDTLSDYHTDDIELAFYGASGSGRKIILKPGIFKAGSHMLIAQSSLNSSDFDQIMQMDPTSKNLINKSSGALSLEFEYGDTIGKDEVCWGGKTKGFSCTDDERYVKSSGIADGLSLLRCEGEDCQSDFVATDSYQPGFGGFIADTYDIPQEDLKNTCTGLELSEIAANSNDQFIEIYNSSGSSLNLKGCGLMTSRNSKKHIFGNIELSSGQFEIIRLNNTELSLTKTTAGAVKILNESDEVIDEVNYSPLKPDSSWSKIGANWQQTFRITPGQENQLLKFLPCDNGMIQDGENGKCQKPKVEKPIADCEAGYSRNSKTGRCIKNTAEAKISTPCKAGYERNPETGRCVKLKAATALAPCKAGYYRDSQTGRCRKNNVEKVQTSCKPGYERNPETGRCNKIKTDKEPTPCKDGYERNPETGRCRKIIKNNGAKNPVEEIPESESTFSGWLVVLGLAVLGVGIIIWEFRSELSIIFKKWYDKIRKKK